MLIYIREEIDEETQEWERAQIRRSGLKPDEDSSIPSTTRVYKPTPSTWPYSVFLVSERDFYSELVPPLTEIPSLESSILRLSQMMTSIAASHAQNTTSVSALSAEQVQLDERETELRDIVARAEGKRSWFADLRDWLESVATFLDEKVWS